VTLRTERLVLRRWRPADRAPFAAINADPRVMEHFPRPITADESDAFADRIEQLMDDDGYGLWAVEVRGGESFIGYVGLSQPSFTAHFTPAVEVGWRLAAGHWGMGYATEAARAAVAFGFSDLRLDEIVSFAVPQNVRSRAVMERLGMTHDPSDDFDHPRFLDDDRMRRHVLYRLSQEGWGRGQGDDSAAHPL
jgi:RimJ/RimL family protein N-acetyltransferase